LDPIQISISMKDMALGGRWTGTRWVDRRRQRCAAHRDVSAAGDAALMEIPRRGSVCSRDRADECFTRQIFEPLSSDKEVTP